jgi:hypothetical protein
MHPDAFDGFDEEGEEALSRRQELWLMGLLGGKGLTLVPAKLWDPEICRESTRELKKSIREITGERDRRCRHIG